MPKRIYIAEDDANILSSLQAKLSLEGFLVGTSSGNIEVGDLLREIKKFKPDFIILDLILPAVDGFDVIKAIKADEEISLLPIFIFTNLSDEDSRSRSLDLGIKHYFIKNDFNIDEFISKFKKIIANIEKIK
ncbi:MAG: response regulator [Patescibacteria group bacterium]|nr:response regulator [Patescibacteria group bacterium]MDD5294669.1 response regulator [Patescibacteria group bacterium]MDD5554584.1 response regulator [Patescibacteria group bacterium]